MSAKPGSSHITTIRDPRGAVDVFYDARQKEFTADVDGVELKDESQRALEQQVVEALVRRSVASDSDPMAMSNLFKAGLQKLMDQKGVNSYQIASALDVAPSTVYRMFGTERDIELTNVQRILTVLQVEMTDFLKYLLDETAIA